MRAMTPPRRQPRTAAAQVGTEGITQAVTSGTYGRAAPMSDERYLAHYNDWQSWARRYARQIGAASFAGTVTSDCCSRCDVRVEERLPGTNDWVESVDPMYVGMMEEYRNDLQTASELVRLHAWHYQIAGEMVQVQRDTQTGVSYQIFSTAAIQWDKPDKGQVTVKMVPNGTVATDTAFVVPREQVIRFWIPDQEWQAYAWSPMAASIDDLHRYRSLARYAWHTADSALAMDGMLWTPPGAHVHPVSDDLVDEDGQAGTVQSTLEQQYYEAARLRFSEMDDITAIAPFMVNWEHSEGLPTWVQLGRGLDAEGIAHRKEALEDFARSSNLPVTTVLGGGVGDANHWSEWLASDKFFSSAVAPTMDRICHTDLTRTFLWPRARLAGRAPFDLRNVRVGYDPSSVIVTPDNSAWSLQAYQAGLLDPHPALESAGYSEDDMLTDAAERDWLLAVKSSGKTEEAGPGGELPAGPGNVTQAPPVRPLAPVAAAAGNGHTPTPVVVASLLGSVLDAIDAHTDPR